MRISDWSSDVCSSDLAIDNIREASRRRSAHIILASANTPAKIRKVERGCAVANTPDCSDSVKEIAIFTAANSLPVAKQITGWRCRACEIHNRTNRHAIARGLHYRSKVSGIGAGCSVVDGEAAHVERGPHSAGAIAIKRLA